MKITGSGILQYVESGEVKMPDQVEGKHLWCCGAVWEVNRPELKDQQLDMENMINIDGPACWWCEEMYTRELAAKPCLSKSEQTPFDRELLAG